MKNSFFTATFSPHTLSNSSSDSSSRQTRSAQMCISERDVSFINDPLIVRLIYSTGHPAEEEAFITEVPSTLTPPSLRQLDGANADTQAHKNRRTHAFCFKGEDIFFCYTSMKAQVCRRSILVQTHEGKAQFNAACITPPKL